MSKYKSICQTTNQIRDFLNGNRQQIIVPVKCRKGDEILSYEECLGQIGNKENFDKHIFLTRDGEIVTHPPLGKKGDVIWVKEKHAYYVNDEGYTDYDRYIYRVDGDVEFVDADGFRTGKSSWISPILMPKDACRLWLRIIDVCVRQIKELPFMNFNNDGISMQGEDPMNALANMWGYNWENKVHFSPQDCFVHNWQNKYENTLYDYNKNPYLWIYKVEMAEKPKDF